MKNNSDNIPNFSQDEKEKINDVIENQLKQTRKNCKR